MLGLNCNSPVPKNVMNAFCGFPTMCTGQKSSPEVLVVLITVIPCPFKSLMKRRQPGRRSHLGNIQFSHGSARRRAGNIGNRREKPGLLKPEFVRGEKVSICRIFSGFTAFWKMAVCLHGRAGALLLKETKLKLSSA